MPESFARVEELGFLTPAEKLKLNQIRGFDYLCNQATHTCAPTSTASGGTRAAGRPLALIP
jgi:hypothetical protein